jgi:hypothetical protein
MGTSLYALDSRNASLTAFDMTDYGALIEKALNYYNEGDYDSSAQVWQDVLKRNNNYTMAFDGIGMAALQDGDYQASMKNYLLAGDYKGWGNAFTKWRKDWVSRNITWLVLVIVLLFLLPYIGSFCKKRLFKKRVRGKKRLALQKTSVLQSFRFSLYVCTHPFDGFWDLTHEKRGSIAAANALTALTALLQVFTITLAGKGFVTVNMANFNAFIYILRIILPLFLWVLVNWALTTLWDGKGTMREIYMGTAYALTPYILCTVLWLIFSHLLSTTEGSLLNMLQVIGLVWSALLILSAMMEIHDYTPGKTLLSSLVCIVGMAVVIFIFVIMVSLVSDTIGWGVSFFKEAAYRVS